MLPMYRYATAGGLLITLALAGACSSGSADEGAGEVDLAAASDGSGGGDEPPGVRIRLTLAGGPHAGTHEITPPGSGCIPYQSTGLNGLGIMYYGADPFAPKGIVVLDFGTTDRVPTAAPTDSFGFKVAFGGGEGANIYEIKPGRELGTGKLTVTGRAPRYTAKVTGTTADGVGVEATLECIR